MFISIDENVAHLLVRKGFRLDVNLDAAAEDLEFENDHVRHILYFEVEDGDLMDALVEHSLNSFANFSLLSILF